MTIRPHLLTSLVAALIGVSHAQTAQDIVNRVDATQRNSKDISFRLAGTASLDTAQQKLDLLVKTIPAQNLIRVQFAAPDALADNIVVADKTEVRQYLYLTNQITVTSAAKAAGNAGLTGLDFTQLGNTAAMLSSYNVKLLGSTGAAGKRIFQLEATPKSGQDSRTLVWISEAGWRPTRLQVNNAAGKTIADLTVSAFKTNAGLTAATLRQLPKDAQVIRQ
ncbi:MULTISPECIES: outer membrane lipoprotein carrier protein LolA [Deinococcus]|uniref:Outer membrane lipoprotein carrier protein LolA n=1 Tax=Deinococcus rufus TaxID=2136097 RepID=A0ABV7ZCG5_9DEIO|nr:outer membrane lipoprotein carrier protein LolA [Deinococcus sp. AB2017081]WQE94095.1 outer membrane lipoprotein carrier protein LolA [Deinococcus sp. AB2017081]